ncbi:tRNA pseudouridine synthase-like 1 isoform X4 [Vidua chalybeata]|uniref:tRNA pseudouridine synthase-like 1 isoform X4 n=1 Tax=Vidua chalybeata TaxID=81927 RepID=UPI0023A7C9CA|nr:tRNA pseudouridine synthase-like 1 isoform X4 [Vidua chalybeata]
MAGAPARYLVFFQYFGTRYSGVTETKSDQALVGVQNYLERAAQQLKPSAPIKFHISSRTDSGVHALANAAHLDIQRPPGKAAFTAQQLVQGLNHHLRPEPIRILSAQRVSSTFQWQTFGISVSLLMENLWIFCVPVDAKSLEFGCPCRQKSFGISVSLSIEKLLNFGVPVDAKSLEFGCPCHLSLVSHSILSAQHLPVENLLNFGDPVDAKSLEFWCPCQQKTFGISVSLLMQNLWNFCVPVDGKPLEFGCPC